MEELQTLIASLRARGTDRTEVEVKRAGVGAPNLAETLCAFGNMPSGGLIVLGLDEAAGFAATGVNDVGALEAAIASQARQAVKPPVQVTFKEAAVDGQTVLLAQVSGLSASVKPCTTGGKAYLRQSDGDYPMSEQEMAQLLALRDRPRFDRQSVEGSAVRDLDPDLLAQFISAARASSRRLAAQTDADVLRNKGVLEADGDRLTVAGVYALGSYPQRFAPSLSITAAVVGRSSEGTRDLRDLVHLDGPLPELLDQAMDWVTRNTRTTIRFASDGHGRDEPEIPMVAVRELIANALVHRDLSPHTQSKRVEIRLKDDVLVIANPGGLWGISREQLGKPGGKSAVNEFLYEICKLTRTAAGARVIEGEGGGIREVQAALQAAGMSQPRFSDTGVRFTALLPRHALLPTEDLEWLSEYVEPTGLTDVQRSILVSMRHGEVWTNGRVRDEYAPIDSRDARTALQGLVTGGFATADGERGQTSYQIRPEFAASSVVSRLPQVVLLTPAASDEAQVGEKGPDDKKEPGTESSAERSSQRPQTKNGERVLEALSGGPLSKADIVRRTGLTPGQVGYALDALEDSGYVLMLGSWGDKNTRYQKV